jgi:hypothetical protein
MPNNKVDCKPHIKLKVLNMMAKTTSKNNSVCNFSERIQISNKTYLEDNPLVT